MVFTHTGRLGDFFCMLPVLSWWHKENPDKEIHIVLAGNIDFVSSAIELCSLVPFINSIKTCEHQVKNTTGGQPYQFNPNDYGYACDEYINIGFRSHPDKFIPQFFAEEHGFGVDVDFKIELPDCFDLDLRKEHRDKTAYSLATAGKDSRYELKYSPCFYTCLDPNESII